MNHNDRINLSTRHELEVRQVIDMANAVAMYLNQGRMPDALQDGEVFDDLSELDRKRKYHPSVQPFADLITPIMDDDDYDGVLEELNLSEHSHLLGIYIQVATPKTSWGHYHLQWIYGDTYEDAFTTACEWAKEMGHDYD